MKFRATGVALPLVGLALAMPVFAAPFAFSNGNVTDLMAVASRPSSAGKFEIETGDDFILANRTLITGAGFIGLLPAGASISQVVVEIYRVFPKDSANPPSGNVPTRVNSPSDVAFDSRDSASTLTFSTAVVASSFTALNSVLPGSIHPKPNQQTFGSGPVTGNEVSFSVNFTTPFDLAPDHYFFIPQVAISGADGNFLWLSSVRPIVAPGTPFAPDLQAWTRDQFLDPDWLRVGTDIVGGQPAPRFNLAFALQGETVAAVPEPESWALMIAGLTALGALRRRRAGDASA